MSLEHQAARARRRKTWEARGGGVLVVVVVVRRKKEGLSLLPSILVGLSAIKNPRQNTNTPDGVRIGKQRQRRAGPPFRFLYSIAFLSFSIRS